MYKNGFGINDLQWLMCHKTKPNQDSNLTIRFFSITPRTFVDGGGGLTHSAEGHSAYCRASAGRVVIMIEKVEDLIFFKSN